MSNPGVKKPFNARRVLFLSLISGTVGVIVLAGVYMKAMGWDFPDVLWVSQRELQYCPRCGMQRWEHVRGFLFGLRTNRIEEKPGKKIAGIDRANCDHLFYTVAEDGKLLATQGFKIQKFKIGKTTGDTFWDAPVLVEAFRALEKENQVQAFTLFQFLVNEKQRGAPRMTNLLEAVKGTNSQAVVDGMFQLYTNAGNRLPAEPSSKGQTIIKISQSSSPQLLR
jgi:hypothetical protein